MYSLSYTEYVLSRAERQHLFKRHVSTSSLIFRYTKMSLFIAVPPSGPAGNTPESGYLCSFHATNIPCLYRFNSLSLQPVYYSSVFVVQSPGSRSDQSRLHIHSKPRAACSFFHLACDSLFCGVVCATFSLSLSLIFPAGNPP